MRNVQEVIIQMHDMEKRQLKARGINMLIMEGYILALEWVLCMEGTEKYEGNWVFKKEIP